MVCLYCNAATKVTNSRSSKLNHDVWRRRVCTSCGATVTTREVVDLTSSLLVQKRSGKLEPYSPAKILLCLSRTLQSYPHATETAETLAQSLRSRIIRHQKNGCIKTALIHDLIIETLTDSYPHALALYKAHSTTS